MLNMTFGESWFSAKKRLNVVWNEEQARIAHEKRSPYVVVIATARHTSVVIEFNNDYIGLGFMDTYSREFLVYQFEEIESSLVFLSVAIHREFDGVSDKVIKATTYRFDPNGKCTITTRDYQSGECVQRDTVLDVSMNWDRYPAFGHYESIMRIER
jgi:hypothetical protein